jgi:hypothetical protein
MVCSLLQDNHLSFLRLWKMLVGVRQCKKSMILL